jgi:hypothetical protein
MINRANFRQGTKDAIHRSNGLIIDEQMSHFVLGN